MRRGRRLIGEYYGFLFGRVREKCEFFVIDWIRGWRVKILVGGLGKI